MASRICCSSSSPRCTRSSAAGVARLRPSAIRDEQRLERVAQVAHRRDAGHARAALQRVQEALQHRDGAADPGVAARPAARLASCRESPPLPRRRSPRSRDRTRSPAAALERRGCCRRRAGSPAPARRRPAARETRARRATSSTARTSARRRGRAVSASAIVSISAAAARSASTAASSIPTPDSK